MWRSFIIYYLIYFIVIFLLFRLSASIVTNVAATTLTTAEMTGVRAIATVAATKKAAAAPMVVELRPGVFLFISALHRPLRPCAV